MIERELAEIIDKIKRLWPRCTVLQNPEQAVLWKSKLNYYPHYLVNQAVDEHFTIASTHNNPDLNKILQFCREKAPRRIKRLELPENYVPATQEEKEKILLKLQDEGCNFATLVLSDPNLNPLTMFKMKFVDEAIKEESPKPNGAVLAQVTEERRPDGAVCEDQAGAGEARTRLPFAEASELDEDIPF